METENGKQFIPIFKAVRLQHIMNDVVSVRTLEADGIIPESKAVHTEFGEKGFSKLLLYGGKF